MSALVKKILCHSMLLVTILALIGCGQTGSLQPPKKAKSEQSDEAPES